MTSSVPSTPDRRGDAAGGEAAEAEGRDPGVRAGLAAAAGQVDVAVDQAGNDAPPLEVVLDDAERGRQVRRGGPIQTMRLTGHEQMAAASGFGVVQVGVAKKLDHASEKLLSPADSGYWRSGTALTSPIPPALPRDSVP